MGLGNDVRRKDADTNEVRLHAQLATVRRELTAARTEVRQLLADNERLAKVAEFRDVKFRKPPTWLKPPKKRVDYAATACLMLSDLHLDEVVDPDEMMGLNAYNRDIAEQRLERIVYGTVRMCREQLAGVRFDGLVCGLLGDLVSGSIHEELAETNEGTPAETVRYWTPKLASALQFLADEFGAVHVPVVFGNHGRFTKKPRHKKAAQDNADTLIGHLLAMMLDGDDRITFDVSPADDCRTTIYGTTFLFNHLNQVNGGGGIGGIYPPLMRLRANKLRRYAAYGQTFDYLVGGHWHSYLHGPGLIVNGSLKGYDEFAAHHNFVPERPQQAFFTVTPEHGITIAAPIFASDLGREGWEKKRRSA